MKFETVMQNEGLTTGVLLNKYKVYSVYYPLAKENIKYEITLWF